MSMQSSNAAIVAMALVLGAGAALAQSKYDPGASDTEIVIGQTNPYSGPLSSYSTQGRVQTAYYAMINEQGGVNGRKIKLISLDEGYSPPRTVEQHRKMVEEDNVLAIVGTMGTPTNSAIIKYMNAKQVPQIFIATGASKWGANPTEFPWTMGWYPTYRNEGVIYGKYIVGNIKDRLVSRVHGEILSAGRHQRSAERDRHLNRADLGAGSQTGRQRSHPREYPQAGGEHP